VVGGAVGAGAVVCGVVAGTVVAGAAVVELEVGGAGAVVDAVGCCPSAAAVRTSKPESVEPVWFAVRARTGSASSVSSSTANTFGCSLAEATDEVTGVCRTGGWGRSWIP
jgi:hypothetical protein